MNTLSDSLYKAFLLGWPQWQNTGDPLATSQFTIRLSNQLRDEATKLDLNPATIIAQAGQAAKSGRPGAFSEFWKQLERSLIVLIYGSNFVEAAGSSLQITTELCRDVFHGIPVTANVDERNPSYQQHLQALTNTDREPNKANVIQSRKEAILHARALSFMINRIVLNNKPWSEELIFQAHAILYEGLDNDVTPGQYRDHDVAVSYEKPGEKQKWSICMRAKAVPVCMRQLITSLNNDIASAEASGEIDPYTLSGKIHDYFLMIRPFGDGNGRMARIILNVLLLKYAGHVAHIGSDNDKGEYLDVVRGGQKISGQEDMEVDILRQKSHRETARFILFKSKSNLEQMWSWASRRARVSSCLPT
ncbi:hypothetical protein ACO1O0_008113 [Amphichorda felina]